MSGPAHAHRAPAGGLPFAERLGSTERRTKVDGDITAYRGAHFHCAPDVVSAAWSPIPWPAPCGARIGDLLSLPVVVDESLPAGEWRLVDSQTGEVIYRSTPCDRAG